MSSEIPQRLEKLRELMTKNKVDAYLIPSTDPHKSEYLPACWQRRKWLSGFTGSAGDVLVTKDWAGLWTDSRYFLQAGQQLEGSGIELMKMGMPDVVTMVEWAVKNLKKGSRFGVDPCLLTPGEEGRYKKRFKPKGIELAFVAGNLVDIIWKDQPKIPLDVLKVMPVKYAGESVLKKLGRLREKMSAAGCKIHIVSALDRTAWLYNLRGCDVDYNPVFISYAVVTDTDAFLYVDNKKVTKAVRNALKGMVKIRSYTTIEKDLLGMSKRSAKVWIDSTTTNMWIVGMLKGKLRLHKERSPIAEFKALKNKTELKGMRDAHVQDGQAMVKFLKWLEESVKNGNVT